MSSSPRAAISPAEGVALAITVVWVLWVAASTVLTRGSVGDATVYVLVPFLVICGFVFGSRLGRSDDPRVLLFALVGLCGYVLLGLVFRGAPGGGPLGYANANAAMTVQLVSFSSIVFLAQAHKGYRGIVLGSVVLGFLVAVLLTSSRAGMASAVAVVVAITVVRFASQWLKGVSFWVWNGLASTVIAYLAMAVIDAARGGRVSIGAVLVDSGRQVLWSDAFALWTAHPILGSGPGSFADYSPLAQDPDTERVHSSVLQIGSELGLTGVMLAGSLIVATYSLIAMGSRGNALIASAALTALLLHSLVDHILEFPAVVMTLGAVIGLAVAADPRESVPEVSRRG